MRKLICLLVILFAVSSFAQSSHSVSLSWTASADAASNPTLTYSVYRGSGACPSTGVPTTLTKISSSLSITSYTDTAVTVGQTYCYTVTASLNGSESAYSNTAGGTIPIGPPSGLTVTVK